MIYGSIPAFYKLVSESAFIFLRKWNEYMRLMDR